MATPNADASARAAKHPLVQDPRRPEVQYAHHTISLDLFRGEVARLTDAGGLRICDVGGGAKPLLSAQRVAGKAIDYVVLDIDPEELALAPPEYEKVQGDILQRETVERLLAQGGQFDLVMSRWAAEHMRDGRTFHEHVLSLLRPGGVALHLFPTLFALPFTVNRLLPTGLSEGLLRGVTERTVKFPAHYSWCRGPTHRQLARLRGVGYEIDRYVGFFGHGFFAPVPPLNAAYKRFVKELMRHPRPALTSFALVALERPRD